MAVQIGDMSSYIQQIMHNDSSTVSSVNSSGNSKTYTSNTIDDSFTSFDDLYNTYQTALNSSSTDSTITASDLYNMYSSMTNNSSLISSVTGSDYTSKYDSSDNLTSLEIAQDAYADLLEMQANAISGSSSSDDDTDELYDYLNSLTETTESSSSI